MGVNVQAAVEAQLLGANLVGMLSKTSDTLEFLVMPSSLDENEPITVNAVVKEINETIYKIQNNTNDIDPETKVPELVTATDVNNAMRLVGLENAALTFMQTFIHYQKVIQNEKEISKTIEYAIGIHIKGNKEPDSNDFKFLQIREAYINVWDTTNQKVLERMKIWTPEQLQIG